MDATFQTTPALFGKIHVIALLLILIFNIFFHFHLRKRDEKTILSFLHRSGLLMILAEIFKQWFCFNYVFNKTLNLWFFPFQLCSMPMYLSFLVSYFRKEKQQNVILVFLATFSLFSDIVALILPYDMLRDQIVLTVHSFAYHGLILVQAAASLLILSKRRNVRFFPSACLFLFLASVAFMINAISHKLLNNIYIEPNMFYITPSYPTTQPVFHEIAVRYSIPVEIIVYLSCIILVSYLFFLIERRYCVSDQDDRH